MAAPRKLDQPVVVVTGGSSGIGLATAQRLAQQPGARLVLAALAPEATGRAAAQAARRFFLDSGAKASDSDGALFAPRALPAAVHGHWGRPPRRPVRARTALETPHSKRMRHG